MTLSLPKKFIDRIRITESCWLWLGVLTQDGYGRFHKNNRYVMAHRFSYEQKYGKIKCGLTIDHLCRVRGCVNPDHLEAVEHIVNVRRGGNAKKTHCKNGHLFDDQNTRIILKKDGKEARGCAICHEEYCRKYRAMNRPKMIKYLAEYRAKKKNENKHP